jgi:hypothetical protein
MVQTSFVELKEKRKRKQKKIILKQYVASRGYHSVRSLTVLVEVYN